jgi:RimJ/RimL family protein N-acetyltransferase
MLEGRLVRLRALEPGDLEPNYRWVNDAEVIRYLDMRYPISRVEEERWLRGRPANDFSNGVFFAIETKDGVYIGNLALPRPAPGAPGGRAGHRDRREGLLVERLRHGRHRHAAALCVR